MKKNTIVLVAAGFITLTGAKAQNIQEGINHLYADRDQSAKSVFEKILATNPNNIDATYWLGQADIALKDTVAAKTVYENALRNNGNAPLLLVGMGQVELMENKKDEARQRFETAINLSRGKKGDDPNILNAIGKANVEAKAGDLAYAIDKLKVAVDRDSKNADIFLNLGNAYRKAHEGGQAVINYDEAMQVNSSFAVAAYREALLYYTQKNWDVYEEKLKKAVQMDPKFAPAYYELYYYALGKKDFTTAQEYATKYNETAEPDPQNDYLRIQTLWAQKNYDEAIAGGKTLIAAAGDKTKARTYKLMAYAYADKGDTAGAKPYIDEYFAKADEDEIIAGDYIFKGQIYAALGSGNDVVYDTYMKAAAMDSVESSKIDLLKKGADWFKAKGDRLDEANMRVEVLKIKKDNPTLREVFDPGVAYYFAKEYNRADSIFDIFIAKWPGETYGYEWEFNVHRALDSTGAAAVPFAEKLLNDIYSKDSTKYAKDIVSKSAFLVDYYANTAKDYAKALEYCDKILAIDPENASFKSIRPQLLKALQPPPKAAQPKKNK